MTQSEKTPLFFVSNRHAIADAGNKPPFIDGDSPKTYHSYFENLHGDQLIFIRHRATGETLVYSGDARWNAFPVVDGKASGMNLSPDEELWLQACLRATGQQQ